MTAADDLDECPTTEAETSRPLPRWRRLGTRTIVLLAILLLIVGVSIAAPLLAPHDPLRQDLSNAFAPADRNHWFGTDELGRDMFARVLYAGRISILAAVEAVGIALLLGLVPGFVAGYMGGWVDSSISRVADVMLSFPPLIIAIALVGALGPGLTNAMVAIGVMFAPRFLRLVRGVVQDLRRQVFMDAARTIGTPVRRVLTLHVLPNVATPLVIQVALTAAAAILAEASLSFLGMGVQPPDASWGSLVASSFRHSRRAPWLAVYPGAAIVVTVLVLNMLGDSVRGVMSRWQRARM